MSRIMGDVLQLSGSPMYTNRRRARARISDDFVMRDAMTKLCNLRVFILRAGTSQMRLSHVVIVY
jgi:hypothetical protein